MTSTNEEQIDKDVDYALRELTGKVSSLRKKHPQSARLGELIYGLMRDAAGSELRRNEGALITTHEMPAGNDAWLDVAAACVRLYLEGSTKTSPQLVKYFSCLTRPEDIQRKFKELEEKREHEKKAN